MRLLWYRPSQPRRSCFSCPCRFPGSLRGQGNGFRQCPLLLPRDRKSPITVSLRERPEPVSLVSELSPVGLRSPCPVSLARPHLTMRATWGIKPGALPLRQRAQAITRLGERRAPRSIAHEGPSTLPGGWSLPRCTRPGDKSGVLALGHGNGRRGRLSMWLPSHVVCLHRRHVSVPIGHCRTYALTCADNA